MHLPHFFLPTNFIVIKISTQSPKPRILDYGEASASQKTFRLFSCREFCAKHFWNLGSFVYLGFRVQRRASCHVLISLLSEAKAKYWLPSTIHDKEQTSCLLFHEHVFSLEIKMLLKKCSGGKTKAQGHQRSPFMLFCLSEVGLFPGCLSPIYFGKNMSSDCH